MIKKGQAILDFLNSLPLEILQVIPRAPVNNKEAQTLYDIWKGDKDEYGRSLVPDSIDPLQVAALTSKGMIKSRPVHLGGIKTVDITAKGKEVIRNIIFHSEKSSFEEDPKYVNYEAIHQAVLDGPTKSANKVASSWMKGKKWN